jgi:hypothetical protein
MGVAVANVSMEEAQIRTNIMYSVNFLVSLLKKNWQVCCEGWIAVVFAGQGLLRAKGCGTKTSRPNQQFAGLLLMVGFFGVGGGGVGSAALKHLGSSSCEPVVQLALAEFAASGRLLSQ